MASNASSSVTCRPCKHSIRLRGPWECRPLVRQQLDEQGTVVPVPSPLPAAGSLSVPGDWRPVAGVDFRGVARFVRRFGRPTGLESRDRVILVVEQVGGRASVSLHGEKLADSPSSPSPLRIDLTDRLQAANELWIDVEWLGEPACGMTEVALTGGAVGGSVGEVRLEICDS